MKVSESLTDVCKELNNWFDRGRRLFGTFTVSNGKLSGFDERLKPGQFYRVIKSAFNDGVHSYGDAGDILTDETFDGAVWIMFVPPNIIRLAKDIADWREVYEAKDSPALSPFAMESYKGYMYQMRGGMTDAGAGTQTWQSVFAARLNAERKF